MLPCIFCRQNSRRLGVGEGRWCCKNILSIFWRLRGHNSAFPNHVHLWPPLHHMSLGAEHCDHYTVFCCRHYLNMTLASGVSSPACSSHAVLQPRRDLHLCPWRPRWSGAQGCRGASPCTDAATHIVLISARMCTKQVFITWCKSAAGVSSTSTKPRRSHRLRQALAFSVRTTRKLTVTLSSELLVIWSPSLQRED